jgi:hypothetical protein
MVRHGVGIVLVYTVPHSRSFSRLQANNRILNHYTSEWREEEIRRRLGRGREGGKEEQEEGRRRGGVKENRKRKRGGKGEEKKGKEKEDEEGRKRENRQRRKKVKDED